MKEFQVVLSAVHRDQVGITGSALDIASWANWMMMKYDPGFQQFRKATSPEIRFRCFDVVRVDNAPMRPEDVAAILRLMKQVPTETLPEFVVSELGRLQGGKSPCVITLLPWESQ